MKKLKSILKMIIRIYLKWNDDSENGATMDNNDDTIITTTTSNVAKVNVNFFIALRESWIK